MKKLVEIHILQNFAPSNLNRDDTGAPKDGLFGGTRRARISSQCFKRAVRQYFNESIKEIGLDSDDVAFRTKRIFEKITESLDRMGHPINEAKDKVRLALSYMGLSIKDDGKSEYLLFLGRREISKIVDIIHEQWESITATESAPPDEKKSSKKARKKAAKNADPKLKEAFDEIFNGGKAVDLALFGRMLADLPEKNQLAACQVAHAISTHAVEREFDFYTAVDDLKPEDTAGADMIGTVEFNSACFYRYALIDYEKLVGNLQGDDELAAKGLRAFLEGFVVAEPTGKQNTFAAHNPPEFVAVSVRRNAAPRSLANAFETAICVKRDESLTRKSAEALVSKAKALQTAFGGIEKNLVLNLTGADINGLGTPIDSLRDLLDETISTIQE